MSATAGIMRALMPFCFKELESFGFSLNNNWRLIYHYGFVRNLLEKGNPRLANIRTAKGEPAIPIRVTNLHKFGPLWKYLGNLVIMKASRNLIGRQIVLSRNHHAVGYPLQLGEQPG